MNLDTMKMLLVVGAISGLIGGSIGMGGAKLMGWGKPSSQAQMQKLIVLSPSDFMDKNQAINSDAVRRSFENMKETANKLALDGYIVLSAKAVLKAPDSAVYTPTNDGAQ